MTATSSAPVGGGGSVVTREDLDSAKAQVGQCEEEIETIKRLLHRISPDDLIQSNQLDIAMIQWEGLPLDLLPTPIVKLQLSSPVEEICLEQLWDPLVQQQGLGSKSSSSSTTTATTTDTTPSDAEATTTTQEDTATTSSKRKSIARFVGVETSMATLTVTTYSAMEQQEPLGTSESIDVSLLCPLDALHPQDSYLLEWPVTVTKSSHYMAMAAAEAAAATATSSTGAVVDATREAEKEVVVDSEQPDPKKNEDATADAEGGDDAVLVAEQTATATTSSSTSTDATTTTAAAEATTAATTTTDNNNNNSTILGIVTLRIHYTPSPKDQRDALHELLNKASLRKNAALGHLRQVSLQLSRSSTSSGSAEKGSSMKSGFLRGTKNDNNNSTGTATKQQQKRNYRLRQLYEITLGLAPVAVVAKNYVIFVAAVLFFHYRGHHLALPPPV